MAAYSETQSPFFPSPAFPESCSANGSASAYSPLHVPEAYFRYSEGSDIGCKNEFGEKCEAILQKRAQTILDEKAFSKVHGDNLEKFS